MADRISVRLTGIRILFGMETACRKGPHICTYIAMERSVRWKMLSTSRRRTWSEFTCVLPAKRVVRIIIKVRYHIASTVIMPFAVPMQNFISDKMCFAAAPEHPPHISTSSRAAYLLNAALHRKTLIFNRTAVLSIHYIFFSHTQPLWHRHRSNKFAATVMYGDGGFFSFLNIWETSARMVWQLFVCLLFSFHFFCFCRFEPIVGMEQLTKVTKNDQNQKQSKHTWICTQSQSRYRDCYCFTFLSYRRVQQIIATKKTKQTFLFFFYFLIWSRLTFPKVIMWKHEFVVRFAGDGRIVSICLTKYRQQHCWGEKMFEKKEKKTKQMVY